MEFCIRDRWLKVIFFLVYTITRMATVINPTPPTWIMARITSCPKSVQWVNVSYLISPVTQVAEVAVKKQSETGVPPGPLVAMGRASSMVPTRIMAR